MQNLLSPAWWLAHPARWLGLITLVAASLSAAGPVMEWLFTIRPCQMCMWQRYSHYTILAAGLIGLAAIYGTARTGPKGPKPLPSCNPVILLSSTIILLAAAAGLFVAVWQSAAQLGLLGWPEGCSSSSNPLVASPEDLMSAMSATKLVPCDRETFRLFGLSLANWNIPCMLFILATAALGLKTLGPAHRSPKGKAGSARKS